MATTKVLSNYIPRTLFNFVVLHGSANRSFDLRSIYFYEQLGKEIGSGFHRVWIMKMIIKFAFLQGGR